MHVLCGVSGGADSVALLRILCELRDEGMIALTAAHLEHGIRGADSIADRDFVDDLCGKLRIPLITESADIPRIANEHSIGIELAARDARHSFLRRAKRQCGADLIALAHHSGDQAETVLMHMARGSGVSGAKAMSIVDGDIWRPFLKQSKARLMTYLDAIGQPHREDATNLATDNPRNALRHRVMPQLAHIYPGAEQALCRFAAIARDEDALLSELADAFCAEHVEQLPMGARIRAVPKAPTALVRRALMRMTTSLGADSISFELVERMAQLYRQSRGKLALSPRITAERTGQHLYLIDRAITPPAAVPIVDGATLAGLGHLALTPCAPEPVDLGKYAQVMDADALNGAVLRCRLPGDRFRMLGSSGSRALSDVLIDRRVDRPLRDFLPLIADGPDVLFIPGIGVSDRAKIDPHTTRALRAAWTKQH